VRFPASGVKQIARFFQVANIPGNYSTWRPWEFGFSANGADQIGTRFQK
jgi:hypothetical protein